MLVWVTHACSQLTRYQSQPNWLPKICAMLKTEQRWVFGLVVWFSLRVREVASSILATPLLLFYVLLHSGPPFALEFGDPSANMQQAWLCFCMSLVFLYIYIHSFRYCLLYWSSSRSLFVAWIIKATIQFRQCNTMLRVRVVKSPRFWFSKSRALKNPGSDLIQF